MDQGVNAGLFEGVVFQAYACPSNPYSTRFKTLSNEYFDGWKVTDEISKPGLGPTQGLAYPLCAGSILPDHLPPDCNLGPGSFCVSENPVPVSQASWWNPQSISSPAIFNRGVTSTRIADITDGASNTFAAGERNAEECAIGSAFTWNAPVFFTGQLLNSELRTKNPIHYWRNCGSSSHHTGGAHFLLADGAVRFINDSISFRTYCALGDKSDGEAVSIGE